jgi:hypothetical protein
VLKVDGMIVEDGVFSLVVFPQQGQEQQREREREQQEQGE